MTDKKLQNAPLNDAADNAQADARERSRRIPDSSYQDYLFGSSGSSEAPAWSDSIKGRMFIRLVSRGIFGAAFFAIGGRMAHMQLKGYHPDTWKWKNTNFLQTIAKGIDATWGKTVQYTVKHAAGLKHGYGSAQAEKIAKNAVTFRDTRDFKDFFGTPHQGRSIGAEMVGFTFDFAMASIGDALARNAIQAFDPNIHQTWRVNDEGKPASKGERWHFKPWEFTKWAGDAAWRIFSKNQGEDWAAAIPYAFQMKFQRKLLNNAFNKRWDGHKFVFDNNCHGGAYRVDTTGKIVGDYQLVGAIDLHARFVGYNWYTLMYREGYDAIANAFHRWRDNGYALHMPHLSADFNLITTPANAVLHAARYVTKSFIKANMYMNPAVVPFWLFRVPQSKWRGERFVNEGNPALGVGASLGADSHRGGELGKAAFNPENYKDFKPGIDKTFSKWLNPIGRFSYNRGTNLVNATDKLYNKGFWQKQGWFSNLLHDGKPHFSSEGTRQRHRFMHEFVDASISYTPYMDAKQEFGLRVDDTKGDGKPGQMDNAIYKLLDDVTSFKFRDVPADIKEMWKLGKSFEQEVKAREGDTVPVKPAPAPVPKIHASTVQEHVPASLAKVEHQGPAANDEDYHPDLSWAKSVSGSDIHRIHSGNQTRH